MEHETRVNRDDGATGVDEKPSADANVAWKTGKKQASNSKVVTVRKEGKTKGNARISNILLDDSDEEYDPKKTKAKKKEINGEKSLPFNNAMKGRKESEMLQSIQVPNKQKEILKQKASYTSLKAALTRKANDTKMPFPKQCAGSTSDAMRSSAHKGFAVKKKSDSVLKVIDPKPSYAKLASSDVKPKTPPVKQRIASGMMSLPDFLFKGASPVKLPEPTIPYVETKALHDKGTEKPTQQSVEDEAIDVPQR